MRKILLTALLLMSTVLMAQTHTYPSTDSNATITGQWTFTLPTTFLQLSGSTSPLASSPACSASGTYWLAPIGGTVNAWQFCGNGVLYNLGSGGSGVTAVTASSPLASSGGTTPNITFTWPSAIPGGTTIPWGQVTSTPTTLAGYGITSPLDITEGGTGTTTPSLVAGTNVTISGSWPNQTVNSTGGGIGGSIANQQLVGGTGTNTVGAITDGTATWQWGQDSVMDLDCYGDANCEIQLRDAVGNYAISSPTGLQVSGPSSTSIIASPNLLQIGGGAVDCAITNAFGLTELCNVYLTTDSMGDLKARQVAAPGIRSGSASPTDLDGRITLSSGSASQPLTQSYSIAPNCFAADVTSPTYVPSVSESTTTLTFTGNGSDVVKYSCTGRD